MLYLVLLFTIIFTGLAWYRPVLALQLTLFALPSYLIRFKVGVPMTLLEVMILINFGVWFVREWHKLLAGLKSRIGKSQSQVINYPFAIEMVTILILSFVAMGVSGFTNEAMGIWKAYFFEPLLLLIVIYNVFGKLQRPLVERLSLMIWPLVYSSLAVTLLAVYQKITGDLIGNPLWAAEKTRRVVSVFGYPNAVGLYVESIALLTCGLLMIKLRAGVSGAVGYLKKFGLSGIVLLVSMHLCFLAIAYAKSNGAALGLAAGFSVVALLYSKRTRLIWLGAVVVVFLVIFGAGVKREKVMEYLTLQDFSGQVRIIGWTESWNMLKDGRFLTGAGLANFQSAVTTYHVPGFYFNKDKDPDFHRKLVIFDQKYRDKFWQPLEIYMYPHNIILNFWSELGLLGMLAFVWLIFRALYVALKMYYRMESNNSTRLILLAAIGAIITTLVHGLVDVPYFKNDLAVLFWVLIGIVGLYELEERVSFPASDSEGRESRKAGFKK